MVHSCPCLLPLLLGALLLSGPPGGAGQSDIAPGRVRKICGDEAYDQMSTAVATATATGEGQGSDTVTDQATAILADGVIDWSPAKYPHVCPDSCQASADQWGKECIAAFMLVYGTLWSKLEPDSTVKPDALAVACGWQ